jgi:hypothetical protein
MFTDGSAQTDDPALIGYYQGAGFLVDGVQLNPAHGGPAYADNRDHPPVLLGTPLRDAAVDPRPGDLTAEGAGGNPHSPDVVHRDPVADHVRAELEREAAEEAERDALEKAAKAAQRAAEKAAQEAAKTGTTPAKKTAKKAAPAAQ